MAPAPTATVLDLDGVVIESSEPKSEVFVATFAARWPDWEERVRSFNRAHFGVPRRTKMTELLSRIVPDQPAEPLVTDLLDGYARRLADALTAFPLVPGVAALIRSRRYAIFICSAEPMAEIRLILAHHGLLDLVETIFDGETPKSAALTRIAADHPGRCLFVGDAAADLRAARTAGVPFVLRASGTQAEQIDAETIIHDFHDFESLVAHLLR